MKRPFDLSKLTPLPDHVINALANNPVPANPVHAQTIIVPLPTDKGLIADPNVIFSPLPALTPIRPIIPNIIPGTAQMQQVPIQIPITKLPTIPVTTLPKVNMTKNNYVNELQLAPLSPRSPRIVRTNPPPVVVHPTAKVETETCCVCYDEEIPTTNLLKCKHPLCSDCTKRLPAPYCPMCKANLEGPLVTDVALADILNRQDQGRLNALNADYLAALYLEEHPEANPEEVYEMYRN